MQASQESSGSLSGHIGLQPAMHAQGNDDGEGYAHHICAATRPTSALRLAHICAATRPTSAPRLGPHLRRDSADICAATRPTSAPRIGHICAATEQVRPVAVANAIFPERQPFAAATFRSRLILPLIGTFIQVHDSVFPFWPSLGARSFSQLEDSPSGLVRTASGNVFDTDSLMRMDSQAT